LRWSPKRLKRFCETHAAWVLELGPRVTPTGIERLYWRHVRAADGHPDLIAEIARDPRTPRRVIRDIWARFRSQSASVRKHVHAAVKSRFGRRRSTTRARVRKLVRRR